MITDTATDTRLWQLVDRQNERLNRLENQIADLQQELQAERQRRRVLSARFDSAELNRD